MSATTTIHIPTAARPAVGDKPAFFAHHGLMAPGIRLFRSIGFQAKAAWVSAAFMLPMLLMLWTLWGNAQVNIDFSAKERLGVEYARVVLPLLDAAQNRRRAATAGAPDLPEAQQKVQQAMDALAKLKTTTGHSLGIVASWEALVKQQQALAAQPTAADTSATFALHTAFIEALMQLYNDVADNSNLTLDPEVHTYYLMEVVMFRQPQLVEAVGQLRGMGNAVLNAGALTPAQRDLLSSQLAFAAAYLKGAEVGHARAAAADATLVGKIDLKAASAETERFLKLVREQLLGEAVQGDAAAYVKLANEAIALHYASADKSFTALAERLQARVDGLWRTLFVQIGLSLTGVALAVYLLVAFYRVTQGGISEVARQLEEISRGNLTLEPRPWGKDEVAGLMNTLANTVRSLRGVVSQVRNGAGEIHVASSEVAKASSDLSSRTEDTAAQLQRTSSAMAQIGATVRQTADTAAGAAEISQRNRTVAGEGGRIVGEAVQTMGGISDSSRRIADIIGTIDGIAFQTNILALNAAVEAARAGEQGRGFAVVASEVRSLAQRSAEAAREIKTLIGRSVESVESGTQVVGKAGATMQEIVGNAGRISELIGSISHASAEQSSGIAEVSAAVAQLDGMTQQNAALVEQTAAAASTLSDNAQRLKEAMGYFKLP
jgi:methyl-accepting chemotaxis protein